MRKLILLGIATLLGAVDVAQVIESPDAVAILQKDALPKATVYTMPAGCVSDDPSVIARGKYLFHNLNGKDAKDAPPEGLAKLLPNGKEKQYGNCVACHNIQGAQGHGNVGPDLTKYHTMFVASGARNAPFVYQKIADARMDNPKTHMTINLTTKLFNEREVCDLTSYILSQK